MSNPIQDALANPQPAPEFAQAGDVGPEVGEYERPMFPLGCPVKALGISSSIDGSQKCYYLDVNGQLVGLEAGNRHGKNSLIALFGPKSDWLEANWTMWSKPVRERVDGKWVTIVESKPIGFDQAEASRALIEECVRKGIFDPAGRMRGRGAHKPARGEGLVLHCGDVLLTPVQRVDGTVKDWLYVDAGLHERYVYQAAEPIARPHHDKCGTGAAEQLLGLLQTWQFKRKLLDARFALGAIALGPVGGASPWRPHIYVTGGAGTGKSSLNGKDGVVHRVFGNGVFRTADTSAAGVRQSLRNSTVPVMIDEFEASKNNDRVQEVITLARIASSGDELTRGGSDHNAAKFTLQSCFWFSSINIPPMEPADRSRFAILELDPIPDGTPPLDLAKYDFEAIGAALTRRMIDGWARFGKTKLKFHEAMTEAGHSPRACDQFATLLAAADVVLNDHDTEDRLPDDEEIAFWADKCRPQRLAEITDTTPDHVACVQYMLTSLVQSRGGDEREAVGTWIGRSISHAMRPVLVENGDAFAQAEKANERLHQLGLKLVNAVRHPEKIEGGKVSPARWGTSAFQKDEPGFLAVAGQHNGLGRLFEGSKWNGGVWKQALARNKGAIEGVKVKFSPGVSVRAVLVPLSAVLDEEDLPESCHPDRLAEWLSAQLEGEA
ncbi:hypothetical protein [Novosphingobium sp. RL4]|uniref:hypothetical protein n=1 Tax=Novosphingobium sp. RL4 TaxID=3109595 RepID=UPI002D76C48D|nr:hypothetical protein [Novosphingobium sp. RL4]WRT91350.1 hypothetical protein U9J33_08910 [Novosphingobium sp. RL4]